MFVFTLKTGENVNVGFILKEAAVNCRTSGKLFNPFYSQTTRYENNILQLSEMLEIL